MLPMLKSWELMFSPIVSETFLKETDINKQNKTEEHSGSSTTTGYCGCLDLCPAVSSLPSSYQCRSHDENGTVVLWSCCENGFGFILCKPLASSVLSSVKYQE